jgi:hypothetical protein
MDKPEPELDLNALRKGLDTRLYYADEANKNAYQEKVNTILEPVRDWYQSKERWPAYFTNMDNLRNETMHKIRESLNDDNGFYLLLNKLPKVEEEKKIKETELDKLHKHRDNISNNTIQNIANKVPIAKRIFGNDKLLADLGKQIEDIQADITFLINIIKDINALTPIYNDSSTSGGKRKSRRNRKNKKSRQSKSRKILKRAYARSENTKKNKKNKKK